MNIEIDNDIDIKTDSDAIKKAIDPCLSPCPIERGMRILGGKWKGSILWHLKDGPMRFNDLARQIGGASKKMVTQRLREMEDTGLVNRNVISTKPIAVAYEITDFGRTALKFLEEVKKWAEEYNI
ncbi:MAG: helix-turn-helix transcriptional regulator [Moorea sp. SIO4G3]|nr:helix-turn-helix transcriptional regulator [Moorena sp. SIO4G3]